VLEAVRNAPGVKSVINITTDKCYENREWVWGYRENEPMGGFDFYSNSKGCAELVTAAYRNSYFHPEQYKEHGVALASARAGNVIGGGDWAENRLIPDIMHAIIKSEPVIIRNPHAIRSWQHVFEPLTGYLVLAQKLYEEGTSYVEAWNFGPNDQDAKPLQWIVDNLTKAWDESASWILDEGDHHHEAYYLKLDCSKAKARLNWIPKWRLDKALNNIISWQKQY
jgi:CDP-glucose 4,6-dehydratase